MRYHQPRGPDPVIDLRPPVIFDLQVVIHPTRTEPILGLAQDPVPQGKMQIGNRIDLHGELLEGPPWKIGQGWVSPRQNKIGTP